MEQCRFCLLDDIAENLVQPCACTGSARSVHLHCLRRWQRQQVSASCEVCKAEWSLPLDPLERNNWLRSVSTNPNYRAQLPGALDVGLERELRHRMRPGTLILQTPTQAAETALMQQRPIPQLDELNSSADIVAILASVLQRRTSHWFQVPARERE